MQTKPKITEIKETSYHTRYKKDAYGNRIRVKEPFIRNRKVKTISAGPRFAHFFIDAMIFSTVISIVSVLLESPLPAVQDSFVGELLEIVTDLVVFALYPFLYFICERNWQQTPGKMLTKTFVIDQYGNKPSNRQLILRSLIRLVPFEPYSCFGDLSRGWHDKWSDTWVVKKEELIELKNLMDAQLLKEKNV